MSFVFRKVLVWSCIFFIICFFLGFYFVFELLFYKVLLYDNCLVGDLRVFEKLFYFLDVDFYFWYKDFFLNFKIY